MQTFLPMPSFALSSKVLDRQRLGKQRLECKQILKTLRDGGGWRNHPAVKMWQGFEYALCEYAIAICTEWRRRGYKDSLLPYFLEVRAELEPAGSPPWLEDFRFHASHRSNLLRKDPTWYGQFGWKEPADLPYVWPA